MSRDEILKKLEALEEKRVAIISSAQFQLGQVEGQIDAYREILAQLEGEKELEDKAD